MLIINVNTCQTCDARKFTATAAPEKRNYWVGDAVKRISQNPRKSHHIHESKCPSYATFSNASNATLPLRRTLATGVRSPSKRETDPKDRTIMHTSKSARAVAGHTLFFDRLTAPFSLVLQPVIARRLHLGKVLVPSQHYSTSHRYKNSEEARLILHPQFSLICRSLVSLLTVIPHRRILYASSQRPGTWEP